MKHKKHWNSFQQPFFVDSMDLQTRLRAEGAFVVNQNKMREALKEGLFLPRRLLFLPLPVLAFLPPHLYTLLHSQPHPVCLLIIQCSYAVIEEFVLSVREGFQ